MKAYAQKVDHTEETSFVYRVKVDQKFARARHYHPEFELTHIESSSGRRFVGESIENYRSGDMALIGSNLPHAWISDDQSGSRKLHRAVVIHFAPNFLGEGFLDSAELTDVALMLQRADRGLRIVGWTRDEVAERMRRMKGLGRFPRLLELLDILQTIANGGNEVRPICEIGRLPARRAQRRIDRVLAHLVDHHSEEVHQGEVANMVGMSPAAFSRFFKANTGTTFVAHVNALRISSACNLLLDTDLSVLEVSSRAGFNNLSNFNRRFLASVGMTPREYRRRQADSGQL